MMEVVLCREISALGVAIALAPAFAMRACGEVRVEGSLEAVRVTTNREAVAEILSALSKNFSIRYRTGISLNAAANKSYSGSVRQVLSHLLDRYTYVIKKDKESTEIVVFGYRGEIAVPPPTPKSPAAEGVTSRWR
jgi:hypothetical protein